MSFIGGGDVLSVSTWIILPDTLYGADGKQAAAVAAVAVDVVVHPMDTVITRIQSPAYKTQYRQSNGWFHRNLFLGLYQGFGPTLVAGIPASAAFFSVYEGLKTTFEGAQKSGHLQSIPLPILHAVSGASADIVACAIINPAEVLKQNAQVSRSDGLHQGQRSHVMHVLRQFSRQPTRLWTGYTMLVASSLPGTSLTLSLYEWFKQRMMRDNKELANDIPYRMKVSAVSAAIAAGCVSCIFVPVDVVKTRMRLAAGSREQHALGDKLPATRSGPMTVARDIFRTEGVRGLFRGLSLTFIASIFGAGVYLSCYEGCKLYLGRESADSREREEFRE